MRRVVLLVPALAVAVTACSGPTTPIDIGVKNLATSFHYGLVQGVVAAPNVPGAAPPPPMGPFLPSRDFTLGKPRASAPPPPIVPPALCPAASPAAIIKVAATTIMAKPPVAASYSYRSQGSYKDNAGNAGAYPTRHTRQVRNPQTLSGGEFTFQVLTTIGFQRSLTTFHYVPPTPASYSAAGPQPVAGLYLTADVREQGGEVKSSFTPAGRGLLLLPVPALRGQVWHSTATDPVTGVTQFVTGTIGAKKLVNACGEVVESVPVHLDGDIKISQGGISPTEIDTQQDPGGQEVSPDGGLRFTADYFFAPQYGGLIVQDHVQTAGHLNKSNLKTDLLSTIDALPARP